MAVLQNLSGQPVTGGTAASATAGQGAPGGSGTAGSGAGRHAKGHSGSPGSDAATPAPRGVLSGLKSAGSELSSGDTRGLILILAATLLAALGFAAIRRSALHR
jgi:hypothetical protein